MNNANIGCFQGTFGASGRNWSLFKVKFTVRAKFPKKRPK